MDAPQMDADFDRTAIREALAPELDRIEAEAQHQINSIKRRGVTGFALPVGCAILFGLGGSIGFGVFVGFIAMVVWWGLGIAKLIKFVSEAQRAAAMAVADALGLKFEREPAVDIDMSAFKNTAFAHVYQHTAARDMMSGVRHGLPFQIFELKFLRRGETGDPKRGVLKSFADMSVATVVRVELRGRWTSRTLVLRDLGLANALRITGKGLDRVRLVDPKFEKLFEVYSTDQTEARAVLTPSFMERLVALEDVFMKNEAPAFAVFDDGAFMVAIQRYGASDDNSSEGTSLKEAVDAAKAKIAADRLLDEIEAVFTTVDALTSITPPNVETGA